MNRLSAFAGFALLVLSASNALTQVPDAGFETWTSSSPSVPTGWLTTGTNVSKSTTAHTGGAAVQGFTVDIGQGQALPATLWSYFPVVQRFSALQGYYQLAAVSGDEFSVSILMSKGGLTIGTGYGAFGAAGSAYVKFSEDIMYFSSEVPDTAYIVLSTIGPSNATPHVGSTFLADDLSLSGIASSVANEPAAPLSYSLSQNYPNPFNPTTVIRYELANASHVRLTVYDILGREVQTLVDDLKQPGHYEVTLNATNLASGVYLYRIQAARFTETRKLALVR